MNREMKERYNMKLFYGIMLTGLAALLFSGCAATETATTAKPQHVDGEQQEEVIIASSSFYEACDKLSPRQQVEYSFKISQPVNFNVHYHTAEGIFYPVKKENIDSLSGVFTAEAKATYCCMWTNTQSVPVSLTYDFKIMDE
jgi:hypothetical protein